MRSNRCQTERRCTLRLIHSAVTNEPAVDVLRLLPPTRVVTVFKSRLKASHRIVSLSIPYECLRAAMKSLRCN